MTQPEAADPENSAAIAVDPSLRNHLARPRIWTVIVTLIAAVGFAIVFQTVATIAIVAKMLLDGMKPDELSSKVTEVLTTPGSVLTFLVLGQLGFAVAAGVYLLRNKEPWRERIAWRRARPGRSIYPLAVFSTAIPTGLGLYLGIRLQGILPHDPSFETFFENLTIPMAIPFVILIGLLPGFFEEIIFRGIVQQRFVKRSGVLIGLLITSILFALAHIMPLNIVVVFPIGAWLCYIAWKANSIWPTIASHFAINSGVNLYRVVVKFGEPSDFVQNSVIIATLIIGAVCFAWCLRPSYWANCDHEPASE